MEQQQKNNLMKMQVLSLKPPILPSNTFEERLK